MRWKVSAPLFVITVFAQARPAESVTAQSTDPKTAAILSKPPDANESRAAMEEQRLPPPGISVTPDGAAVPAAKGQPCAIPLMQVLAKEAARMDEKMVVPLPPKDGPRQFTMREVTPPAPSCDDVKR